MRGRHAEAPSHFWNRHPDLTFISAGILALGAVVASSRIVDMRQHDSIERAVLEATYAVNTCHAQVSRGGRAATVRVALSDNLPAQYALNDAFDTTWVDRGIGANIPDVERLAIIDTTGKTYETAVPHNSPKVTYDKKPTGAASALYEHRFMLDGNADIAHISVTSTPVEVFANGYDHPATQTYTPVTRCNVY